MQRQIFEFGTKPWPTDDGVFQIYLPVDLDRAENRELAALLPQWHSALHGAPLQLVASNELHVTVDVIADRSASEISDAERSSLMRALQKRLHAWPAWKGSAGSALAYPSGAIADLSPAHDLGRLAAAVRQVITEVRGSQAGTYRQSKAHLSLGYCYAPCDSDPWQRALRQVDPAHAPLLLDEVALVDVRAKPDTCIMSWQLIDSFRLATGTGHEG